MPVARRRARRPPPNVADPGPGSRGDPLAGVERVLVDGSNLAYALARAASAGVPRPNVAVIAAVRAAFPPGVRVEVVFDGTGDGGAGLARPGTLARAAANLYVEHSGRRSADRVIEEAVEAQLAADGPVATWGILVVTDDRELRGLVGAKGARVAGTAWLAGRLARVTGGGSAGVGQTAVAPGKSGTSIGHRRPPGRHRC
jgi:hypothetical protein